MAFNFGSLLMNLGRALPGFVEGERQAIQDNWTDLEKYNTVKQGQMSNLFRAASWPYALSNVANQAKSNAINYNWLRDQYVTSLYGLPGERSRAAADSAAAPAIAGLQQQATMAALREMYNKMGKLSTEDMNNLKMGLNAQNGQGPNGQTLPGGGSGPLWDEMLLGAYGLPGLAHGGYGNPYLDNPFGGLF